MYVPRTAILGVLLMHNVGISEAVKDQRYHQQPPDCHCNLPFSIRQNLSNPCNSSAYVSNLVLIFAMVIGHIGGLNCMLLPDPVVCLGTAIA